MAATVHRVALGSVAYSKMALHSLRHPQNAVCGLLVGHEDVDARRRSVTCVDAFPLLHSHFLHPQLRLGLELVEEFCRGAELKVSARREPEGEGEGSKVPPSADLLVASKNAAAKVCTSGRESRSGALGIVGFYYCETVENSQGPSASRLFNSIVRVIARKYTRLVVCSVGAASDKRREWKPRCSFLRGFCRGSRLVHADSTQPLRGGRLRRQGKHAKASRRLLMQKRLVSAVVTSLFLQSSLLCFCSRRCFVSALRAAVGARRGRSVEAVEGRRHYSIAREQSPLARGRRDCHVSLQFES